MRDQLYIPLENLNSATLKPITPLNYLEMRIFHLVENAKEVNTTGMIQSHAINIVLMVPTHW